MFIAIDTNIFEHMLNPHQNKGSHIEQIFIHLRKKSAKICIDSTGRIAHEYKSIILPLMTSRDVSGFEYYILKYWMSAEVMHEVDVIPTDQPMSRIRKIIREPEPADHSFVYVTWKQQCDLISNDRMHIVNRRGDLRRELKKIFGDASQILCSSEYSQAITS